MGGAVGGGGQRDEDAATAVEALSWRLLRIDTELSSEASTDRFGPAPVQPTNAA